MEPILTAQVTQDEIGVTVYCPELNIHTCGRTRQEAENKMVDAIIDYYHFLRDHDFSQESPYKEHLELLVKDVLPTLTEASLLSPRRPPSLLDGVVDLLPGLTHSQFSAIIASDGRAASRGCRKGRDRVRLSLALSQAPGFREPFIFRQPDQ